MIVDYQSDDLDVEAELRASSLPRYTPGPLPPRLPHPLSVTRWKVISKIGGFSRSGGLQAGIDYVTVSGGREIAGTVVRLSPQDPDAIVMTIDMHLTLPPGFVEYTRRVSHTHCS